MEVVNRLAATTDIYVEVEPNVELGAPSDPTSLVIEMAFSPERRLVDDPDWFGASWRTDTAAVPRRFYAKGTINTGDLAEGVWWPFVLIHNDPEQPIVAGRPFRVE